MATMSPAKDHHRVSYVVDANEDTGSVVPGTERYAVSEAPSPIKERPNTSKSRRGASLSRSNSSSPNKGLIESDSTVYPRISSRTDKDAREGKSRSKEQSAQQRDKDGERELDKGKIKSAKRVTIQGRPTAKHTQTSPVLQSRSQPRDAERRPPGVAESPYHYGVSPESGRPTPSARPRSYYGPGSKPPAAYDRWYAQPHPAGPYMPSPYSGSPHGPGMGVPTYGTPSSPAHGQPHDYFPPNAAGGGPQQQYYQQHPQQHLLSRFQRPSSASGFRRQSVSAYPYDMNLAQDPHVQGQVARRPSVSTRNRNEEEDRRRMPPPARPTTTVPRQLSYRPPPAPNPHPPSSQQKRLSAYSYDDEDLEGDDYMYRDVLPRSTSYSFGEQQRRPSRPRGSTYDPGTYRIEPAASTGRRHSYYGGGGSGSAGSMDYEQKLREAAVYQDGGAALPPPSGSAPGSGSGHLGAVVPKTPLTADALRKAAAAKRTSDKSSRSTRSSGSRDESEFRQSNTTRTTRSSAVPGDEDITIKVKGSATLRLGGAEIQCQDGGEINITHQGGGNGSRGAASNHSDREGSGSSVYFGEDARPRSGSRSSGGHKRLEQVPYRPRTSSQAASTSRSPYYADGHGYEYEGGWQGRPF